MRLTQEGNYLRPEETVYCFNCWYPAGVKCRVCKQFVCRYEDCLQKHDEEFEQDHVLEAFARDDKPAKLYARI